MVAADQIEHVRPGIQIREQIGVHAHACINTDQPIVPFARIPAVFQCFPSTFEEEPVLRIHDFGFFGIDPEEFAIELVRVLQHGARFNIIWIVRIADACLAQLFSGKERNGFDAVAEVCPELIRVPGTGHSTMHCDDRDVAALPGFPVILPPGNGHRQPSLSN